MEQGPARRPALPTVSLAAVGAAAVSLAVVAVPWLRMSFEAPSLRVALETGGSLVAVTTVAPAAAAMRSALARRPSLADCRPGHPGGDVARRRGTDRRRALVAARGALRDGRQPRGHADARHRGVRAVDAAARTPRGRCCSPPARSGLVVFALAALLAGAGPALRAPNARWPRFHPEVGRVIVQVAIAAALVIAAVGLAGARAASRCCAGSPSRSCSAASPSSTTRCSRRSGPQTSTSATCCASPAGSCCSPASLGEMRARMRAARRGRRRPRAPPPRPRAARRRRAGAGVHPPPRRPAGRAAGRHRDPRRRRARARGLAARDRGARPARRRAAGRRARAPRRPARHRVRPRGAGQRARRARSRDDVRAELIRIIAEAVRNAAHHGGARHVRVDLAGTPLARARSSTTATGSATAPTAGSAWPATG